MFLCAATDDSQPHDVDADAAMKDVTPSGKKNVTEGDILRNTTIVFGQLRQLHESLRLQHQAAMTASERPVAVPSTPTRKLPPPVDHAFLHANVARVLLPYHVREGGFIDCNDLYSQVINVERSSLVRGLKIAEAFSAVNFQRLVKIAPLLLKVDALFLTNLPAYRGNVLVDGIVWVEYEDQQPVLDPLAPSILDGLRVPKYIQMLHLNPRPLPISVPPSDVFPFVLPNHRGAADTTHPESMIKASQQASAWISASTLADKRSRSETPASEHPGSSTPEVLPHKRARTDEISSYLSLGSTSHVDPPAEPISETTVSAMREAMHPACDPSLFNGSTFLASSQTALMTVIESIDVAPSSGLYLPSHDLTTADVLAQTISQLSTSMLAEYPLPSSQTASHPFIWPLVPSSTGQGASMSVLDGHFSASSTLNAHFSASSTLPLSSLLLSSHSRSSSADNLDR